MNVCVRGAYKLQPLLEDFLHRRVLTWSGTHAVHSSWSCILGLFTNVFAHLRSLHNHLKLHTKVLFLLKMIVTSNSTSIEDFCTIGIFAGLLALSQSVPITSAQGEDGQE